MCVVVGGRPTFVGTQMRKHTVGTVRIEVAKVTHILWGLFINVGNFMGTSVKNQVPTGLVP